LAGLVNIQYDRNDVAFERGKFRVRGDTVEVWPSYEEYGFRIEFWGDEIDKLSIIHPLTGETISQQESLFIYPAKHFVTPEERILKGVGLIKEELKQRLEWFQKEGKLLEAQRLNARTRFDIEMLEQVGHCPGIENYSRPLAGRNEGEAPETLYNFFPEKFLLFVDESHATIPQIRAMYAGDRSRKLTLVEHGFRLPSALDNRPLKFEEWEQRARNVIHVSATPGPYELEKTQGEIVEQIIRPTGLLDPEIEVVPARGQVGHLLDQIKQRRSRGERVLVTALTKRLAEDLSGYLSENGVHCKWLHSELNAFERVEHLRDLRAGRFEALVGVNLLREGLDLPEVSLVAILDADKEGFLRSETSLIQTIGRSARNINAKVILYADKVTEAMKNAIEETRRRRMLQEEFNRQYNITPKTIEKNIALSIESCLDAHRRANEIVGRTNETVYITQEFISELEKEMLEAAEELDFERAAVLRDRISQLSDSIGEPMSSVERKPHGKSRPRRGAKVPRPKQP
jgi:excinuclease ABC subunit B